MTEYKIRGVGNKELNVMFGDFCYYNQHTLHERYTPLGIGLIAQYIKERFGDEVSVSIHKDVNKFLEKSAEKAPDVIGLSVLHHVDVETEERDQFLQAVNAARRLKGSDYQDRNDEKIRDQELVERLKMPNFSAMEEDEELILTISEDGFGKRTSAYEYRIAGRGGQGVATMELGRIGKANSKVVASFSVVDSDQIVMVTDGGQIIRCPVDQISRTGRGARGVTLFSVTENERIVSVSRLREVDEVDDGVETSEPNNETVDS